MNKKSIAVITGALVATLLTGCAANHKPQGNAKLLCPLGGAAVGALAGGFGAVAGFAGGAAYCQSGQTDKAALTADNATKEQPQAKVVEPVKSSQPTPTHQPEKVNQAVAVIALSGPLAEHVHLNADKSAIVGLDPVHFELDKSRLTVQNQELLNYYAALLKAHPTKLLLTGYTDNTGTAKYNQRLSDRRVDQVKQYLLKQGVALNMVSVKALGESDPVASNATPEGRADNRRVELVVIS
ncbi:OmpA family protein [Celerinatantimonas yamalensis]|uniref:OmpA family protein n=1 Tax=Celerinatantimonas yamalensis TaxID=559956 RepID=A0ABW9GBQ8_9GAMM